MACSELKVWKWPAGRECRRHHCHRYGWVVCLACRTETVGYGLTHEMEEWLSPREREPGETEGKVCTHCLHKEAELQAALKEARKEAALADLEAEAEVQKRIERFKSFLTMASTATTVVAGVVGLVPGLAPLAPAVWALAAGLRTADGV